MGIMKTLTINGTTYELAPVVPKSSVTLLANRWVSDGDAHSQVVEVAGATPRSKVDLQPTREQLEEFHHKVLAFVTENDNGVVKAYAIGDKPSGDHTIQVTLTEVEGTGKVRGNTVGTTTPRSSFNQTDPTKADYIIGRENILSKDELPSAMEEALQQAKENGGFDGKSAYAYAKEAGYTGTEAEFAKKLATDESANYVTAYGAVGDGRTDDTAAFQNALKSERVVFVPGGTYQLSSGITIGDNCCLELSQDTVLNFTNTEGNCITLGMLSHLKGNHATVNVPYAFSGNVVYAYSNDTTYAEQSQVPPFTKWDPQWKSGRYVTDLNICKADHRGFHYLVNAGECKGTAVYVSAKGNLAGTIPYMWGNHFSGLRIVGAFTYGIHAQNINDGWQHEMRMDAFIDACETGVCLEECNNTYVSAIIQPRRGYTNDEVYFPYAKNGIKLVRSKNADLSGSRVWDWSTPDKPITTENEKTTLYEVGNEYQQIAMYGNCSGAIINDYMYHDYGDTRKRIYTDDNHNLETVTIIQEPIDRWFKIKTGDPYFFDGSSYQKLVTKRELENHFDTDFVLNFTDVLRTATDESGEVVNGVGYGRGYLTPSGEVVASDYFIYTGFIPWERGQKLYTKDLMRADSDYFRFCLYDADKNLVRFVPGKALTENSHYISLVETDNGFICTLNSVIGTENTAFVRISTAVKSVGEMPMVSIDEPIEYTVEGFLADSVKVKGENVIGNVGEVKPDWIATHTYSEGAPVYDERNLFFENRNSAYLKDYGGSFNVNIGIEYDVYWDGERYTCEAKAYDDEPYLGNGSLVFGIENTGEPFCLYGSIFAADTIAYVKKDNSETATISLKVTTKGEAEYSKMPVEYLPDEVALKSDIPEGGSIDVTAEVGQTIIIKEVDASGKPTKWESAEYQPRTHWTENRTLIGDKPLNGNSRIKLIGGDYYVVVFDGVEYVCECKFAIDYEDGAHYLGNPKHVGGLDNGMPFTVVRWYYGGVSVYDSEGSTNSFPELYHIDVNKVPAEYLPKNLPQVRYAETVICENVTVTAADIMGNGMPIAVIPSITSNPFKEGVIYDVIWNGVKYSCEPFLFSDGALAIGNRCLQFSNGMNTGEPFMMGFLQGMFGAFATEFATFTISIIERTPIVEKLGEEYYERVLFVDVYQDGNVYSTDITYQVLNDAHKRGVPICARVWLNVACYYMWLVQAVPSQTYGLWLFGMSIGGDTLGLTLEKDGTNEAYAVTFVEERLNDRIDNRLRELGLIQ